MRRIALVTALLSLSLLSACRVDDAPQRAVRVGLHAGWPATSLASEAAEWASLRGGARGYWTFVERLAELRAAEDDGSLTDRAAYALIRDAWGSGGDGRADGVSAWALNARLMSPRVRLQQSLAEEARSVLGISGRGPFAVFVGNVTGAVRAVTGVKVLEGMVSACADDARLENLLGMDGELGSPVDGADGLGTALPDDHVFVPALNDGDVTDPCEVILYADPLDVTFLDWHAPLAAGAGKSLFRYTLRFWRAMEEEEEAVLAPPSPGLQGYVVEVSLKSTEYKVRDDVVFEKDLFSNCAYRASECAALEGMPARSFSSADIDTEALKKNNVALVAVAHLQQMSGGSALDAISALRELCESLPVTLTAAYRSETPLPLGIQRAAASVRSLPGLTEALFVNGRRILLNELAEDLERPLSCLAGVLKTKDTLESAFKEMAGASVSVVPELMRGVPNRASGALRVDMTLGGIYPDVVVWYNDLATDKKYEMWSHFDVRGEASRAEFVDTVRELEALEEDGGRSQAAADGIAPIRSNMVWLTVVLDLANPQHAPYLSVAESITRGMMPLRFGFVVVPTSRLSAMFAGLYYHALDVGSLEIGMSVLATYRRVFEYAASGVAGVSVSESLLDMVYSQMRGSMPGSFVYESVVEIIQKDDSVRQRLRTARKWAEDAGIMSENDEAEAWDPLREDEADADEDESFDVRGVMNGIMLEDIGSDALNVAAKEQRRVASLIEAGLDLGEDSDQEAQDFWISLDSNVLVISKMGPGLKGPADNDKGGDDGADVVKPVAPGPARVSLASLAADIEALGAVVYSSTAKGEAGSKKPSRTTVWLVSRTDDAETKVARAMIMELAASSFGQTCGLRTAAILPESSISSSVWAAVPRFVSSCVLVVNGAILPCSDFRSSSDLEVIIAKEATSRAAVVESLFPSTVTSDALLLANVALQEIDTDCGSEEGSSGGPPLLTWDRLESMILSGSNNVSSILFMPTPDSSEKKAFSLNVVIDPLGKHAALVSSFVETAIQVFGKECVSVGLLLVPTPVTPSEGPGMLRAMFSRAVFEPAPQFDHESEALMSPGAELKTLPQDALLTLGVVPPRAWFVAPDATSYDLDNIVLTSLPAGVPTLHAEYILQSLLVEGSCADEQRRPPQGLRLHMKDHIDTEIDTLVMANLGYFQLKTPQPGRWLLNIAEGRGRELFDIVSVEKSSSTGSASALPSKFTADKAGQLHVLVDSLSGARNTYLRVERKPGMEKVPLLDPSAPKPSPPEEAEGLRAAFRNLYARAAGTPKESPTATKALPVGDDGKVHVFSVASGHLYERFLKIMMLSVTKHSSAPVKFWLLENYLSPSFKKVIPHFAKTHSFEVEMVTYRWPHWLREQTEKQRIIWAYKILFLDVLFPLNLHRVIFVDSDQVVRSDLMELMRMDLQGAPYGYTPFCDSRKEVEGFRFWKTGFWKDTLRGAKYHISALYVVDLNTFRETSAGDTLRFIYQSLSADPNSLSNLDQDLPNYAAVAPNSGGRVPIFDLPQEWLWCESWCDDESKKTAKTIDLCNNPMTKEPKLVSAKRIVGEWNSLDDEAYATTKGIHEELSAQGDPDGAESPDVVDLGATRDDKEEL